MEQVCEKKKKTRQTPHYETKTPIQKQHKALCVDTAKYKQSTRLTRMLHSDDRVRKIQFRKSRVQQVRRNGGGTKDEIIIVRNRLGQ